MPTLGRPRDPDLDAAAMSAAISLIVEGGYASLTMDRIAERASASKAALYRRWPNKVALVADAIETFAHTQIRVPDTGAVHDDVVAYLRVLLRAKKADAETFAALGDALSSDPELRERCRSALFASGSANLRTIVARGVERGELGASTDVELLADVVPALIRYRREAAGKRLDEALIVRIADQFFVPTRPVQPDTPGTDLDVARRDPGT